jgi:hypothetical protein
MDTSADPKLNNTVLRIWLWAAVAAAVIGAVMLYPIGPSLWNKLFILIKIGMVSSLLFLLLGKIRTGYLFWCAFSFLAVIMTLLKRYYTGRMEGIFILAIITDILMPAAAFLIYRKTGNVSDQNAKGE